jgi:outer membrane protein assembly factor BamA
MALAQNQNPTLLTQQLITGNRSIPSSDLLALLPQSPNSKFLLWQPKLKAYRNGKIKHNKQLAAKVFENKIAAINAQFIEKTKGVNTEGPYFRKLKAKRDSKIEKYEGKIQNGNWLMTSLGEAPVYFENSEAQKNVEKINKYLFNKGFFNGRATFTVDTSLAGQAKVNYIINENLPFTIKSVQWQIPDPAMETLINRSSESSLLKIGERFEETKLNAERARIETLLRNEGYFLYSRNQLLPKVHYLPNNPAQGVAIVIKIDNSRSGSDTKYKIETVSFIIDASSESELANAAVKIDTVKHNGINFIFAGAPFSTKFLPRKIFLKPGAFYSQTDQYETQKALQNLDQFKFANPSIDTLGQKLQLRFYAIPLEKYQFTGEGGFNVFQGTPGPFANASLKIRNIFGGLESLENQVRVGYEGQYGYGSTKSFEAGINTSINIPLIVLPGNFTALDRHNPRTQLGLGFNYVNRQEYKRLNFRLAANYSWQKSQKRNYNFSLIDLNLINTPYLSNAFDSTLNELKKTGNNLRESFGKSFVSSVSGSYVFNENFLGQNQKGKYLRLFAELGGNVLNLSKNSEIGLVNRILGNNLNYFKFIRLLADYRKFFPLPKAGHILAYRINTGLAISYQKNSDVLPYEKYLFAGGSYSLRAWEPRRLGLNRIVNEATSRNYRLEQPGNLLLESSLEYRFPVVKLYGQLNGAFFVDAGNVWTLQGRNTQAKISDFRFKNVFNQLAMDTGLGIRYDFTYFVLRLDAAAKVIDPVYKSNKLVIDDFFKKNKDPNLKLNWNVGIGYPF